MADHCTTTPPGVFKSLRSSSKRFWTSIEALTAFEDCLALVREMLAAEASVAGWGQDPALSLFWAEAADATARADDALMRFCEEARDGSLLTDTARTLLLLIRDHGDHLDALTEHAWHLRQVAGTYALMPGMLAVALANRLIAAIDLIDTMIETALDDQIAVHAQEVGDLRGVLGPRTSASRQADAREPCTDPDLDLA